MKTRITCIAFLMSWAIGSFADPQSYSVVVPPGYSTIANHLNKGGNTLNDVLPPGSVPDSSMLFKWVCGPALPGAWVVYTYDQSMGGWVDEALNLIGDVVRLVPGEGAFFFNPGPNPVTLTFTGLPNHPVMPNLPCGFQALNFVSRPTNGPGTFENIVGLLPCNGSKVYRWNATSATYDAYLYDDLLPGWNPPLPPINVGESVWVQTPCGDLADPYKWNQPPLRLSPTNIFYGWNEPSMHDPPGPVVADDWVCTTASPVTKIRWWGSFLGWKETNLPPGMPVAFKMTFWTDTPAPPPPEPGFSHPDRAVHQITCTNFTAKFVGWDFDPRSRTYEACFLFEQNLTPEEYFYQEQYQTPGVPTNIFWLSIAAVFDPTQMGPMWGWKTRPRSPSSPAPDDAVVITDPIAIDIFPGASFRVGYPISWPTKTNSWDMAFELFTQSEGDTAKWLQVPDVTSNGVDVNATWNEQSGPPYLLADDFLCTSTGPVTNITIWGSWRDNIFPEGGPQNVVFTLSIHTDIPKSQSPTGYSMPGETIWHQEFYPAQFSVTPVPLKDEAEWWFTPPEPPYFPGDNNCFRYDFPVLQSELVQTGSVAKPVVYWLDVQARLGPSPAGLPVLFGWKSCPTNWNDDACWNNAIEPVPPGMIWQELRYLDPHPRQGQSMDLAFRIDTVRLPTAEVKKWSQPPELYAMTNAYNGWNEYSVYGENQIVADDWVCTYPTPVTDIHWWGSFIGWSHEQVPQLPIAFQIGIWTDVPKQGTAFSHPGKQIWSIYCTEFTTKFVGWDIDPRGLGAPEACFKFEQLLKPLEYFQQEQGTNTYWISIAAVYEPGQVPEYPWGWKTRPRDPYSWAPDDAVRITSPTAPAPGMVYEAGSDIWWPYRTNSWDMAFALTSDTSDCVRVVCSTNITVTCAPATGAVVTYYSYATNICTGQVLPVTCTPPSGSVFPVGTTTVSCVNVTGGITNACSFTVTVLQDTNPPVITCPANIVANTDPGQCSKTNVAFVVTAVDDCDPAPVITCNPPSGSMFPKGVTTVNCTAKDASGNVSSCSFTVTIRDQELPSVTCPGNIVANTDPGQCSKTNVTFTATATDNCPGVTVACIPPSGSTFAKGVTTVTCTATDSSGNTAQCSFTVTIHDLEAPSITCSTNIVIDNATCTSVVVNYPPATASDNCAVASVNCVPASGSLFPIGTTTVVCTATDTSGNSSTCSFTVTVRCNAKWVQEPDLTPKGFDVRVQRPKILADDFLCPQSGPITNIHIWGSWLEDIADPNAVFQLALWSDLPPSTDRNGELIANGNFELAFVNAGLSGPLDGLADSIPPGWTRIENFSGGAVENSSIGPIAQNGPSGPGAQASAFRRALGGASGDWTAIAQNLSINVAHYSQLTLSLDVRVWSHDLEAGGWSTPAFEWPAMVEVDYIDNNGVGQVWRYGWYLNPPGDSVGGPVNDPGQGLIPVYNDQMVPAGMWVPTTFNLLNQLPQAKTITRIVVGGTGWNFESDIDNVSIQGTLALSELVANGNFELAFTNAGKSGPLDGLADSIPPGWSRFENFSGGSVENSSIGPIAGNGPSAPGLQAAAFRRSNGGASGDWTAIAQSLSIDVAHYSQLILALDVRVLSHDLEAGGWSTPAFEWPAMVQVDYVDRHGVGQVWRYGWYLDPPGDSVAGPVNDPGQGLIRFYNDQAVGIGVWVPTSFNLLNELPQAQTITRIIVGGTGWNFDSDIDNVSIRGAPATNAFSQPSKLLWMSYFTNNQYSFTFYPGPRQPFYDPNFGPQGVIGSETNVWEYDFPIKTNAAFWQKSGNIYWLSVSAQGQSYFGWKTAATNWNDDAVFGHVDSAWWPLGDWNELWDPPHERSLDLAFTIASKWVITPPVITNIVVTNEFTLLSTNQIIGLAWTYENGVHYQVQYAPDLGTNNGADIVWSNIGPEVIGPVHTYWETNPVALSTQRFYRVYAPYTWP